jgi:hypothetical protein
MALWCLNFTEIGLNLQIAMCQKPLEKRTYPKRDLPGNITAQMAIGYTEAQRDRATAGGSIASAMEFYKLSWPITAETVCEKDN